MKRVIRSSVVLIFSLRACSLVYLTLAIFAFGSAEIDKHGASKTTKVGFDSIKNPKKSALFLQQHGKVEGDRNQSASGSAVIGDEGNSAALNRFLEHVLRVQNNLKWMDHATRHVNRGPHLDDPYTEQHSAVSANTGDVLEQADIGYGSGLRGKRGFDRNYEAMWMPQKKKYERESASHVPQRVYLDNEIFKRDAEDADFRVPYRFPDMLDRAVYEGGMMADQPLKDWTRKRDLHSSGDWSNSNENLEVTNGEDLWLRDYKPARETLVNSDSNTEERNSLDVDTRNQPEIVSLYNPAYADNVIALRESPVAIRNGKPQAKPSMLDSLKKTVLKLRNNLMLSNKKKNMISKGQSDWWDDSRSTAEIFDSGRHNFDNNLDKEAIWRIKRAENTGDEDKRNSKIVYGAELEERDLKELHDRSKRSRRSFVADLNYTNNQQNILENKDYQETQITEDALANATKISKPAEIIVKSYSNNANENERNFLNVLNKTNVSKPRYSVEEEFFLHDHFINLTIIPSVSNKTNISGLRYSLSAESYLNGYSVNNKSLFRINNDLHGHLFKYTTENQIPIMSSKIISSQVSTTERLSKSVDHITKDRANSLNLEENSLVWSTSTNPIYLSANDVDEDSRRRLEDRRSNTEKLGVAARKIPRVGADDGQSKREKDTGLELPRGNTARGFGAVANESRCRVVETTTIVGKGVLGVNGTRKESREPISGMIKVFEPRGRPYQKQGVEATVRLSQLMGEDGTFTGWMRTSSDVDVGESRNANGEDSSNLPAIDPVAVATARPKAASAMTPKDFAQMIVDNDSRGQQQMVLPLSGGNRSANKSNGNSDTDGIDIRAFGSNGNETMNVKEAARPIARPRESGNNLRRKLLWISRISADVDAEDSTIENARSIPNIMERRHIENVIKNDRGKNKTMIVTSSDFSKMSSALQTRIKREDNAAESFIPQSALKSRDSDANYHTRHKRSMHSSENLARNNAANPENAATAEKVAMNHDEKQESDEEYLNQSAEELKEDYNDREEDAVEENDKIVEDERDESSSSRKFDPIKARVNMLIKQKLEKKSKNKDSDSYKRRKRDMLNMIEYYNYDGDEEQERNAPVNEQESKIKDDEFSNKDNAKIKRDSKTKSYKRELGKKKNENKEEMLKKEREKERRKHKEPKEQIIVDLGERKNKTVKNDLDKKPSGSLESSFENVFNEKGQVSTKENMKKLLQSEDSVNDIVQDSGNVKSKWSDKSLENGMTLSKNSESMSDNDDRGKITSDEINAHVDVNPDIMENILLDIEPIKILKSSAGLESSKDLHEEFEDKRNTVTKLATEENCRNYSLRLRIIAILKTV
ncbi:hypothetical protein DMN91_000450 [Ooceraea biroi]|uniref:Uncharacterized protein n=1 Tax=Ooceraea biroi TaxID=2015173 RepID=A0A3L8E2G8_OOCBI|nr:hypothetical protein DMN91_000450 [Ooceraea biroi]